MDSKRSGQRSKVKLWNEQLREIQAAEQFVRESFSGSKKVIDCFIFLQLSNQALMRINLIGLQSEGLTGMMMMTNDATMDDVGDHLN